MKYNTLSLENIKNLSIDQIIKLYEQGYRLESIDSVDSVSTSHIEIHKPEIHKMSPDVKIIDAVGYEQPNGLMTADIVVKNSDPSSLVLGFDFYSTDATPVSMGPRYVACVPPWSTNGCVMLRMTNLTRKDPFVVYVYRCISNPVCGGPSCSQFSSLTDSSFRGIVLYTGVPSTYQGTLPTECTPCVSSWVCEQPLNGYEYDSCTQTRRLNPICNPTTKSSSLSVNTYNTPPFSKGEHVVFYGILEETGIIINPDINGVPLHIKIQIVGTTVNDTYVTTSVLTWDKNWSYVWTVPYTYAGIDPAGKPVKIIVSFAGNETYQPVTTEKSYTIAGTANTQSQISLYARQTSPFNKGDNIGFYGVLEEAAFPYIDIIGVPANIEIKVGDVVTTAETVTTYSSLIWGQNYQYVWKVPDTVGGVNTSGKPVTITASFAGNSTYQPSSITKNYAIALTTPVPTITLSANKTSINSGDMVTFTGHYIPNTKVNIVIDWIPSIILTSTTTDSNGDFTITKQVISNITQTLLISACNESSIPLVACGSDQSSKISIAVVAVSPTPFSITTDKTSITSGNTVTFSGKYKPNIKINIFIESSIKRTHITDVNTDINGNFSKTVVLISDVAATWAIAACDPGTLVTECAITGGLSNYVNITIAPAPIIKYKCSGAPDYTCSQAADGPYTTLADCQAGCKVPPLGTTHTLELKLGPLSWADLAGLIRILPTVATEFGKAITAYGWLGWVVLESRIVDTTLVIYLHQSSTASLTIQKSFGHDIQSLVLPTLAAIVGTIITVGGILLRFGFLVVTWEFIERIGAPAVKAYQTDVQTIQLRNQTITDMCKSGQLTPTQCVEALETVTPKPITEQLTNFIAVAAFAVGGILILSYLRKKKE